MLIFFLFQWQHSFLQKNLAVAIVLYWDAVISKPSYAAA